MISLASRMRLRIATLPPSPHLKSGDCSPPNSTVKVDPNDALFMQRTSGNEVNGFAALRSAWKRSTVARGSIRRISLDCSCDVLSFRVDEVSSAPLDGSTTIRNPGRLVEPDSMIVAVSGSAAATGSPDISTAIKLTIATSRNILFYFSWYDQTASETLVKLKS